MKKEITFDIFIRGLIVLVLAVLLCCLVNYLSDVLLPFAIAWVLAYLLNPLVEFMQHRLHLRFRILCILLALIGVTAVVAGFFLLIVPPTISEILSLQSTLVEAINNLGQSPLAQYVDKVIRENLDESTFAKLLNSGSALQMANIGLSKAWGVVNGTLTVVSGLFTSLMVLLYVFFILLDYDNLTDGVRMIIPKEYRGIANRIFDDAEHNMNAYFRGQALIALLVGILFSIGFSIIGLPVAIGLGMFIGVLNLVPYLQMAGILPALLLAFLRSMQTGENFWLILFYCFIVFLVVQGIQDLFLTPRIMGKMMGLKPAIILLALSVWGCLLGFVGLIIALPLTTLLISYYRLYILKEKPLDE